MLKSNLPEIIDNQIKQDFNLPPIFLKLLKAKNELIQGFPVFQFSHSIEIESYHDKTRMEHFNSDCPSVSRKNVIYL